MKANKMTSIPAAEAIRRELDRRITKAELAELAERLAAVDGEIAKWSRRRDLIVGRIALVNARKEEDAE